MQRTTKSTLATKKSKIHRSDRKKNQKKLDINDSKTLQSAYGQLNTSGVQRSELNRTTTMTQRKRGLFTNAAQSVILEPRDVALMRSRSNESQEERK